MTALRDLSPEVTRLEMKRSEPRSQLQQTIVLFSYISLAAEVCLCEMDGATPFELLFTFRD